MSAPLRAPGRFPFGGYPRGWFAVALSETVPSGTPTRLTYFGRELIAYRGESGRAYVTGAYCPHLGAHLGHGGVVTGEQIRCPFHGWQFGGDGRCEAIPYSQRIPETARLEAFEVREQNGVIHVFYDPDGGAPWALPELDETGWTPGKAVHWRGLATHPQEIFENTVDMAHIGPVHGGREAALISAPVREGERFEVDLQFQAPGDVVGMPEQLNDVHLHVSMRGLGCTVVHTHVRNVDVFARQRIYATPIDEGHVDIIGIVSVKETSDLEFTRELADIFYRAYVEDFAKDFPIWENKRYLVAPGLTSGDGPIGLYRKWCRQFYPVGNAAPESRSVDVLPASLTSRLRDARVNLFSVLEQTPLGVLAAKADQLGTKITERIAPRPPRSKTPSGVFPAVTPTEAASTPTAPSAYPVASVEEYVATLETRFVKDAAAGLSTVFQWELAGEGGQTFHACVHDGELEVVRGAHPKPTVTLVMDAADYVRMVNGELDGTRVFTSGRGRVKGSLTAAMKMRSLFPQ